MPHERLVGGEGRLPEGGRPVLVPGGHLNLAQNQLDDPVAQVLLVGDMVVERHRLDAELLAEPAHGERVEPLLVGDPDRRAQHAVPRQRSAVLSARFGLGSHAASFNLHRTLT